MPTFTRLGRTMLIAAAVVATVPAEMRAQGVGQLTGQVFDSLFTRAPLPDAVLYVEGLDRVITTDVRGRFSADSVPAGVYRMTFFHPSLDRAGLQAPTMAVDLRADATTSVQLATPSYASVAQRVCAVPTGGSLPVRVLFGAITRWGDKSAVPGALVRASWVELAPGENGARPIRTAREARASDGGGFALCDLPGDTEVRVMVDAGDGTVGVMTYWPGAPGASMIALSVPPADSGAQRTRSVVITTQGTPVPNAEVRMGRVKSVQSDAQGMFTLPWSADTKDALEVRVVGMLPFTMSSDEFGSPPRAIAVTLDEAARRLTDVTVRAAARAPAWVDDFNARRKAGFGSFVTRAEIDKRNPSQSWQMLFGIPGIQINQQSGRPRSLYPATLVGGCDFRYFVDGVLFPDFPPDPDDAAQPRARPPGPLALIPPTEIEAMEIYPRAVGVPREFGGTQSACGVILIWTRTGGRNGK
jgi:hypothetical protein